MSKSPVLEHTSRVNMRKGRKHSWNLRDGIFIISFYYFEGFFDEKCLS